MGNGKVSAIILVAPYDSTVFSVGLRGITLKVKSDDDLLHCFSLESYLTSFLKFRAQGSASISE